ncbi:hypothetical protein OA92_15370 [Marinomonas sp. SBI22]|uniref:hypothetical protein n=1 Tax=unclassified Marinomonas TaxID=196814 RepID=UPI0007AF5676|nr:MULTISPECIES: hypothetical protein [unclassified Marinomonas]KZM40956.1 hypothetical protein OA92_15370 [Marinomonas sp. SBI22]KZM42796.1 hypothetical protein OA91_13575 [Marinomonas sp. SBI8L]
MKYNFVLKVNGERVNLVSHDVALDAMAAGRASFVVQSEKTLTGSVYFSFGINNGQEHGHFYGYIERSTPASNQSQTLFCREKSNVLSMRVPLALRNKTLKDLLTEVKAITGCGFSLPQSSYASTPVPYFVNTGSGFHLLNKIAQVFGIEDFTWQQKRDGLIYIGAWPDSHWIDAPVEVPTAVLDKQLSTQSAELMAIPGLRPGYLLNGNRLYSVRLQEAKMVVSWKKP